MMAPAFEFGLGKQVLEGLVCVGLFDGKRPSLACGTQGGKVLVHAPHHGGGADGDGGGGGQASPGGSSGPLRLLNINRQISALEAGNLSAGDARDEAQGANDLLLVGAGASVMAYDMHENADKFFVEVPDGVNKILVGSVERGGAPMAVVGGNCSIYGYSRSGEERFWTVTGDNVTAMAFCDVDGDGAAELLVGSDDFCIRTFRGEEVVAEVSEAERVTHLCGMRGGRFAFGLANGAAGVYDGARRLWRERGKHRLTAMGSFDLDADGVPEVVCGWSTGQLTVRSEADGSVLFKDSFGGSAVAGVASADYRMGGDTELLCVSESGLVRGYLPAEGHRRGSSAAAAAAPDRRALEELQHRRADLQLELRGLERDLSSGPPDTKGRAAGRRGSSSPSSSSAAAAAGADALPGGAEVSYGLRHGADGQCELALRVSGGGVIVNAVVRDAEGGLFDAEAVVVSPNPPSSECLVPLRPRRHARATLLVQVHVGARATSARLLVRDLRVALPRFARFARSAEGAAAPRGRCEFTLPEQPGRLRLWMNEAFLGGCGDLLEGGSGAAAFRCAGGGGGLVVEAARRDGLLVRVLADDMELCGDVVQDMCRFMRVSELESAADFPEEMRRLAELLAQVERYDALRRRLTADMADASDAVKALVIRAEDRRRLGDMGAMRASYAQLYTLNEGLIGEYSKRANNHQALLAALKEVNQMINKAANLRVGAGKTRVVAECRRAVKANNLAALRHIVEKGFGPGAGPS